MQRGLHEALQAQEVNATQQQQQQNMLPEKRAGISRQAVLSQSEAGERLWDAEAMLKAQPDLEAAKCCCVEVEQQGCLQLWVTCKIWYNCVVTDKPLSPPVCGGRGRPPEPLHCDEAAAVYEALTNQSYICPAVLRGTAAVHLLISLSPFVSAMAATVTLCVWHNMVPLRELLLACMLGSPMPGQMLLCASAF